jgi:tetratricopeptide (TPR) repeat protein
MTDQEHELVPAIRDWLAATSDVDIPTGQSREEARRRARAILAELTAGTLTPDHLELDDDLRDTLWATAEELEERPHDQLTFDHCDRVYRFVSALSVGVDAFDERDQVLHRIAEVGWRSAPGGLEAVFRSRSITWEYLDEERHRQLVADADQLPEHIEQLRQQPELAGLFETCVWVFRMSSIRPSLAASGALTLYSLLEPKEQRFGPLDNHEFLKAVLSLTGAIAARHLGLWDLAKRYHDSASMAFRRTANRADLERVEVERLALLSMRIDHNTIERSAPALVRKLTIPRERLKAQLIFTSALVGQGRLDDAVAILEASLSDPAAVREPSLRAWLLIQLGNVYSYTSRHSEALQRFGDAGAILSRFHYPALLATLTTTLGEHLGILGNLEEANRLYGTGREMYRELGQAQQVGYLSVLRAEMLIMLGRVDEAEAELLVILPLIEKFELRREGLAAIRLLRDAVGRRGTDAKTIRVLRDQLKKGIHS